MTLSERTGWCLGREEHALGETDGTGDTRNTSAIAPVAAGADTTFTQAGKSVEVERDVEKAQMAGKEDVVGDRDGND